MLLQLWKALGNKQPAAIIAAEKRLWTVLFDIVSMNATVTIPGLLLAALVDLSAMDIYNTGRNGADWFTAGKIPLLCSAAN